MRAYYFYILLIFVFIVGVLFTNKRQATPVITYFPTDSMHSFTSAQTSIDLSKNKKELVWDSMSMTDQQLYLRQDVSLLYRNGVLFRIKNKWREKTDAIHFQETVLNEGDSFYQTLTYHYGESHYKTNEIKSIHQLSHDKLYVTKENYSHFASFKNLDDATKTIKELDEKIKQDLLTYWSDLIDHYHIDIKEYNWTPLAKLPESFNKDTFLIPKQYSTQIIGQLWEGLYKNYIIPTIDQQEHNFMPIILFSKNKTHLLVLFKINNKPNKLIQRYPVS